MLCQSDCTDLGVMFACLEISFLFGILSVITEMAYLLHINISILMIRTHTVIQIGFVEQLSTVFICFPQKIFSHVVLLAQSSGNLLLDDSG